jgi:mycoredoxin-dependent peroxiredoxin
MLAYARSGIIEFLLISILAVPQQILPKPQIASAEGKPAPNFTLQDQHGKTVSLAAMSGKRVLLIFYRGYWWPYCTGQLREFAQHTREFDALNTRLLAISVDDREHALLVWDSVVNRRFTILSDPGAQVIGSYGLLHRAAGMEGQDIALDTTLLVDVDGHERWRHVSQTLSDVPTTEEILTRIRETANPAPNSKP